VTEEAPYLCPLSHHRCNSLHQGLSFLPKSVCDVGNVEFARALRLTNNTIEPLSFTVPRIKVIVKDACCKISEHNSSVGQLGWIFVGTLGRHAQKLANLIL